MVVSPKQAKKAEQSKDQLLAMSRLLVTVVAPSNLTVLQIKTRGQSHLCLSIGGIEAVDNVLPLADVSGAINPDCAVAVLVTQSLDQIKGRSAVGHHNYLVLALCSKDGVEQNLQAPHFACNKAADIVSVHCYACWKLGLLVVVDRECRVDTKDFMLAMQKVCEVVQQLSQ